MNKLDKDYLEILKDVLYNGNKKETRNGAVRSLFGKTIRHSMKDGFPILTTKKVSFKNIMTELHWFLSGRTDLKYLIDNNCYIWVGDAYKKYLNLNPEHLRGEHDIETVNFQYLTEEEFINKIKTNDEFAKKWGNLGRIYGAQWRKWSNYIVKPGIVNLPNGLSNQNYWDLDKPIDQIQTLINEIKSNPDSRRLRDTALNPAEIDDAILPPCHTDFQIYTRELSLEERITLAGGKIESKYPALVEQQIRYCNSLNIPTRTISLSFQMRSNDFFLGAPYNISSYGALLCILGKMCNMIPEDLIANLGDCHIYENQIDAVHEQLGIDLELQKEKWKLVTEQEYEKASEVRDREIYKLINHRQPFPLPKLIFNENIKFDGTIDELLESCMPSDFKLENYQSHSAIKAPLSN